MKASASLPTKLKILLARDNLDLLRKFWIVHNEGNLIVSVLRHSWSVLGSDRIFRNFMKAVYLFIFQTFFALLIVATWSTRNVKMVNLAPPLRLLGGMVRNQNYTCEKAVRLTALRNFHIYSLLFHSF